MERFPNGEDPYPKNLCYFGLIFLVIMEKHYLLTKIFSPTKNGITRKTFYSIQMEPR
jgi:hypothetical protein